MLHKASIGASELKPLAIPQFLKSGLVKTLAPATSLLRNSQLGGNKIHLTLSSCIGYHEVWSNLQHLYPKLYTTKHKEV